MEGLLEIGVFEGDRNQTDVVDGVGGVGLHYAHPHTVPDRVRVG